MAILASSAYADHADMPRIRLTAYTRDAAAAEDLLHETFVSRLRDAVVAA